MATSGSVDSGGYQGRVLRFSWSTKSTSGNTRKISYSVTAVGGSSSQYYHHNETVDINGTRVYTGSDSHSVTTGTVLASGDMDINQSVTTTLKVDMHGGIYSRTDNINKSQSWTLDTLIQAPTINSLTVKSRTINSITCTYDTNHSDVIYYKLSTSAGYTTGATNVTKGDFTISGLEPNTKYTINFIARNWAGTSMLDNFANVDGTTYDIAKISSVGNFNHGDNASVVITNPSGATISLAMKIGNTQILSKTVSAGTNTITFTDSNLDAIYKLYGSSSQLTATFIVTTGSYTNSKTCTITLKGNQKTSHTNVSGSWKRGKVWINVSGTWKRGVVWENVNGTWKRGI